jgi:DNA-binding GntR family transcriptional regulator
VPGRATALRQQTDQCGREDCSPAAIRLSARNDVPGVTGTEEKVGERANLRFKLKFNDCAYTHRMSDQLGGVSDDHLWGSPDTVRGGRPRLADRAYGAIRDDLIALRIEPGAPLDERQLSAQLKVGLTPVRDAIKRLTLERLVVTYPRRGTFAAEIHISDERWLTEARTGLEGLAALLAAERASEADRATLIELDNKLEASLSATTSAIAVSMDDAAVHRAIYAAAHNPYLETTLNQYINAGLRIWHYAIRSLGSHHAHPCDQSEVVAAIIARDGARARGAAEAHLLNYSVEVRRLLQLNPQALRQGPSA